jgi:tRNA threonylcarbamoyladenosine biosynthesis protein TsaB
MSKSLLLAVETSGRKGSVAVGEGEKPLAEMTFSGPMRHSAELFTCVEKILARIGSKITDVGLVSIAAGPGSFTGLRIAVTMAKMMALAADVKILPVNTMEVIAENATDYIQEKKIKINKIASILDAKRKHFYVSVFTRIDDKWLRTQKDCLIKPTEFVRRFARHQEPIWLLGEGLVYYRDAFKADGIRFLDENYFSARAKNVYLLGRQMAKRLSYADPVSLTPYYMRIPQALENWENIDNPCL